MMKDDLFPQLTKNTLFGWTTIIFIAIMGAIFIIRPSWLYDKDTDYYFHAGLSETNTILPMWLLSFLLASGIYFYLKKQIK